VVGLQEPGHRRKGIARPRTWSTVPVSSTSSSGQWNAHDPVAPEWPTSVTGCRPGSHQAVDGEAHRGEAVAQRVADPVPPGVHELDRGRVGEQLATDQGPQEPFGVLGGADEVVARDQRPGDVERLGAGRRRARAAGRGRAAATVPAGRCGAARAGAGSAARTPREVLAGDGLDDGDQQLEAGVGVPGPLPGGVEVLGGEARAQLVAGARDDVVEVPGAVLAVDQVAVPAAAVRGRSSRKSGSPEVWPSRWRTVISGVWSAVDPVQPGRPAAGR
jgi:hypothetical protein